MIDDPVAPVGDDKAAGMDYYFASYSNHHIHEEMLKVGRGCPRTHTRAGTWNPHRLFLVAEHRLQDDIRTLGYEYFMSENSDLFKDKVRQ